MSEAAAVLYPARVMHRRRIAPFYRFVYRVFYVLWDIDRLDEATRPLRWVSRNRFNLLSFRDRDHGPHRDPDADFPNPLRNWAERVLARAGIELAGGRIRLLAFPRVFGFAFNPISLWYCEHADGQLRAVIAEVRNTFGESHCYLLASDGGPMSYEDVQEKEKCFHVSPFFDLVGRYRFTLTEPGERLRVAIHESRDGMPILDATLACERRALTDGAVLAQVARMPLMTVKVVVAIHWEALKIWLRGGTFHRLPPRPEQDIT